MRYGQLCLYLIISHLSSLFLQDSRKEKVEIPEIEITEIRPNLISEARFACLDEHGIKQLIKILRTSYNTEYPVI